MDASIVTASAAVMGSLVGGSATVVTAWITQKQASRREIVGAEIRKREALYSEFIAVCSGLAIDSFVRELESPETVMPAYALLNRIRLCASDGVLAAADETVRHITEQYFARNLTIEELRELARTAGTDPLGPFSAASRHELNALRGHV